jgi:hypothetical protein
MVISQQDAKGTHYDLMGLESDSSRVPEVLHPEFLKSVHKCSLFQQSFCIAFGPRKTIITEKSIQLLNIANRQRQRREKVRRFRLAVLSKSEQFWNELSEKMSKGTSFAPGETY